MSVCYTNRLELSEIKLLKKLVRPGGWRIELNLKGTELGEIHLYYKCWYWVYHSLINKFITCFPPSFHSTLILLLFILYREENEELKKELQEIKSRLGGDFSKLNVRFFLKNLITICNISLYRFLEKTWLPETLVLWMISFWLWMMIVIIVLRIKISFKLKIRGPIDLPVILIHLIQQR